MKLRLFIIALLSAASLLFSENISSQFPTPPSDIENLERQNGRVWIVSAPTTRALNYDSWGGDSEFFDAYAGYIFHGVKIENFIYDYDDFVGGFVYVYKAADCSPATLSQVIPLEYGSSEGVKFSNGVTMYIAPFNPGNHSMTIAEWSDGELKSANSLKGTYVMVLDFPDNIENSNTQFRAAVNIKKTPNGYDISGAHGIYGTDFNPNNIVSKTGELLKDAIIVRGAQDMVCEPEWLVEYPGLYERFQPIGFDLTISTLTANNATPRWTDRNTFNLRGNVKDVFNGKDNSKIYSFDKNGTYLDENDPEAINRDENGIISFLGFIGQGSSFEYNDNGQVILERYTAGNSFIRETQKIYNSEGLIQEEQVKNIHLYMDGSVDIEEIVITYSYLEFDKFGNWTKRIAQTGTKKETETRIITYYY